MKQQLEFAFVADGSEAKGLRGTPRYRWTSHALVEEIANVRYVYGRWDTLFGIWKMDSMSGQSIELLPCWSVLDISGRWQPARNVSYAHKDSAHTFSRTPGFHAENAVFSAYFSLIPSSIRLLASRFKNYQWLVLDLIWQVPMFMEILDNSQGSEADKRIDFELFLGKMLSRSRMERREHLLEILRTNYARSI